MKNRILSSLLIVFIFGSACRNDDEDNEVRSGFDKVADKNFRLTDIQVTANGALQRDISFVLDCEKDNIYRFESSETAVTRNGALKCDPNEAEEDFYFWEIMSNDTRFIIDFGGASPRFYNVLINDGNRLILERYTNEDADNDGVIDAVRTVTTYTRA